MDSRKEGNWFFFGRWFFSNGARFVSRSGGVQLIGRHHNKMDSDPFMQMAILASIQSVRESTWLRRNCDANSNLFFFYLRSSS